MKIAIVDDEVLVRVGIHSLVEWEQHGCKIIWEADNGREALDKYEKERPDMLLLDLTMPGIDGIEVIRTIRAMDVSVFIVVISCHEEFDMVRDALKSGANDYLLKHSLSGAALLRIIDENQAERKGQEQGDGKPQAGEQRMLERFLKTGDERSIQNTLREAFGRVLFLSFAVMDYEKVKERYCHKKDNYFQELVQEVAGRILARFPQSRIICAQDNQFYAMLGCNRQYGEFDLIDVGKRLQSSLKKFVNITVVIGIGAVQEGEGRFARGLRQADDAADWHFFDRHREIFVWHPYDAAVKQRQFIAMTERFSVKCREVAALEAKESLCGLLAEYEKELPAYKEVGTEYFKRIIQLVLGDIYTLSLAEIQWLAGEVNQARSIADIMDIFKKGYEQNLGERSVQMESDNYLVKQAVAYMMEHYQEQITLKSLAEYLHVSEGYISRLFKAQTKTNIFKYLNQIRIGKAKKLLRDHTLKPYQVSEMVGFNNRVYFDNVFKSIAGVTPSEYRKNLR